MVRAAFAEKGSPLPKEEERWRAPSIVGFAIVRCGLSSAGGAPCRDTIVRVAADHDGVVPECPGKGTAVADVVLDVVDDGTLKDPSER